jgi:hypothetical protein
MTALFIGYARCFIGYARCFIGYARCSTDQQDLTAQREGLAALGVAANGYTSTTALPAPIGNGPVFERRWLFAAKVTRWL